MHGALPEAGSSGPLSQLEGPEARDSKLDLSVGKALWELLPAHQKRRKHYPKKSGAILSSSAADPMPSVPDEEENAQILAAKALWSTLPKSDRGRNYKKKGTQSTKTGNMEAQPEAISDTAGAKETQSKRKSGVAPGTTLPWLSIVAGYQTRLVTARRNVETNPSKATRAKLERAEMLALCICYWEFRQNDDTQEAIRPRTRGLMDAQAIQAKQREALDPPSTALGNTTSIPRAQMSNGIQATKLNFNEVGWWNAPPYSLSSQLSIRMHINRTMFTFTDAR